jgi:NUMOD3 motif
MEKYGFIYIWYDHKHKRFYIGCHWGTEDDGYICSSNWMRDAYRRRPEDFKRRIIQRIPERTELLILEHKWLSFIKENELGKRYYNLRQHKCGHWSHEKDSKYIVGQKITKSNKDKKRNPHSEETKRKMSLAAKNRPSNNKGKSMSTEQKKKIGLANSKSLRGKVLSIEHREKISNSIREQWKERKCYDNH